MDVAPAHLDAYGAGAPAAARPRRHPGLGLPAGGRGLARGLAVARRPPAADADLGPAGPLRRLRLRVVLRDLPPADDLAGRLHHPAPVRLRPCAARQASAGTAEPPATAGVDVVRHRRGAGGRPGSRRVGDQGPPVPCRLLGGLRRGRGRARPPARGRQPRLPPRRDRGPRRCRRGQPLRLQGWRDPAQRRGLRLLQQPHPVRRLRPREPLRPVGDGALLLQHHRLRRRVDDRGQARRAGAQVRRAPRLRDPAGRRDRGVRPPGQPPALHREHRHLPDRPRLRTGHHRPRRRRQRRPVGADHLPAHQPADVRVLRRGQGS